ncbi:tight adherence protein B [Jatrophihabitans sp. GAS493]|uniref:type II secretion system F family protein n=1 Tax=Jatrophihabitans sp. GAS493 TaxID=1907575 RepID=UPI000BB9B28C|nr:type II secretion system F family protein [Jatrophihabitans sp. GAS493]SOD71906.1 tight adherence protein B [Jatrophihabitans sp. GAS493]
MLSAPVAALGLAATGCLCWPTSSPALARLRKLTLSGRLARDEPGLGRRYALESLMIQPRPRAWRPAILSASLVVLVVVVALGGGLLGLPAAAATAALMSCLRKRRQAAQVARDRSALLAAVATLRGELLAGSRPADALEAVRPALGRSATLSAAFAAAEASAREGEEVAEVLLAHDTTALLRPVAAAWRLAEATGAPIATVLGRVQADLRDAGDIERAVQVAVAGPRASAMMLATLPVLGLVLGSAVGARPISVLTGSVPGQLLGCAGVLLELAGVAWTGRITAAASRC